MKYSVNHGLSPQRARAVIEHVYGAYQQRLSSYNPSLQWKAENEAEIGFTVMKKSISTVARIDGDDLTIEGKLPLLFRPFQRQVLRVIEEEVNRWLAKAKAGDI